MTDVWNGQNQVLQAARSPSTHKRVTKNLPVLGFGGAALFRGARTKGANDFIIKLSDNQLTHADLEGMIAKISNHLPPFGDAGQRLLHVKLNVEQDVDEQFVTP